MIKDENQILWSQTVIQAGDTVNTTTGEVVFASKPPVFTANSLLVGDVIRFKARGLYGTGALSLCAFTFRVKIGSVAICSSASISTAINLTSRSWVIKGEASIYSIGAAGSLECGGEAMVSTGTAVGLFDLMPTGGVVVDTTSDQQFQISVQPSISLLANTVTLRQFFLEKLRAQ